MQKQVLNFTSDIESNEGINPILVFIFLKWVHLSNKFPLTMCQVISTKKVVRSQRCDAGKHMCQLAFKPPTLSAYQSRIFSFFSSSRIRVS